MSGSIVIVRRWSLQAPARISGSESFSAWMLAGGRISPESSRLLSPSFPHHNVYEKACNISVAPEGLPSLCIAPSIAPREPYHISRPPFKIWGGGDDLICLGPLSMHAGIFYSTTSRLVHPKLLRPLFETPHLVYSEPTRTDALLSESETLRSWLKDTRVDRRVAPQHSLLNPPTAIPAKSTHLESDERSHRSVNSQLTRFSTSPITLRIPNSSRIVNTAWR